MKKLTKEWIEKAEGDYKVSINEQNAEESVYDAICFHAHQCIEKYMKAILVEKGESFEKIHDLELLLKQCKQFIPELEKEKEALIWLTQFSVRVRYPGFCASGKDAKRAVRIMKRIRKTLRKRFGLGGK